METVKNLNDSDRTGRARATTQKQDQPIVSLAWQQTFVTSRDITSEGQWENGATMQEQNTIDLCRRHYCRKPLNELFKKGARSQTYGREPSDLLRWDNHCVKRWLWNLPGQKRSCERIQSKSMFVVAYQVKASVASSILNCRINVRYLQAWSYANSSENNLDIMEDARRQWVITHMETSSQLEKE